MIRFKCYENYVYFMNKVIPKEEYHTISVVHAFSRITKREVILTLLNLNSCRGWSLRVIEGGPSAGFGVGSPFMTMS